MKSRRHRMILQLIENEDVETQEQLTKRLADKGMKVTQATVSRDIKDLGLIKQFTNDGRYKYGVPAEQTSGGGAGRAKRIFQEFVTSVERSFNLIIVHSSPGTANTVAAALDSLDWPEVAGTVAGDDSVLIIVKDGRLPGQERVNFPAMEELAASLEAKLNQLRG